MMPPECCPQSEYDDLVAAYDAAVTTVSSLSDDISDLEDDLNTLTGLYTQAVTDRDTLYVLKEACYAQLCINAPAPMAQPGEEPESFSKPETLASLRSRKTARDATLAEIKAKWREKLA